MAVILLSNKLQRLHDFLISAFADQELGRLLEADNGDSSDGHGKDQSTTGEPDVAPARIGVPVAWLASLRLRTSAGEVGEESPREETGDELADAPPGGHQSEEPCILRWQVLQEDSGIQDEVSAGAKSRDGGEDAEDNPVGRCAGNNSEDATNEEGVVKGVFAAYDIRAETPEESTDEHARVDGDGQAGAEGRLEFVASVGGDDGLEEKNEGVDGIAVNWSVSCAGATRRALRAFAIATGCV